MPIILTLIVLALLVGIIVTLVYLHKERRLFFKKKIAAGEGDAVSYHGNVVSFTNPVLEHKMVIASALHGLFSLPCTVA